MLKVVLWASWWVLGPGLACAGSGAAAGGATAGAGGGGRDGGVALVRVEGPPAGEQVAAAVPLEVLLGGMDDVQGPATVAVDGRAIALALPGEGEAWLSASEGGRPLWALVDPPAAGGSEVSIVGRADRRVVFVGQSRIGTWALDVVSGQTLEGYDAPVVAPDGRWALLLPYFNGFTGCVAAARPVRLRLDAPLAARDVPAGAVPAGLRCSEEGAEEVSDLLHASAAIAPDGAHYAVAVAVIGDDGRAAAGRVELLRAADDAVVASLEADLPPVEGLRFAASGRYLVLEHAGADGARAETWLRIDGLP